MLNKKKSQGALPYLAMPCHALPKAWQGMARHGKTWQDMAWKGLPLRTRKESESASTWLSSKRCSFEAIREPTSQERSIPTLATTDFVAMDVLPIRGYRVN